MNRHRQDQFNSLYVLTGLAVAIVLVICMIIWMLRQG